MAANFVPTTQEIEKDFPECQELGFYKVRVGEDALARVDMSKFGLVPIALRAQSDTKLSRLDRGQSLACAVHVLPAKQYREVWPLAEDAGVLPHKLDMADLFHDVVTNGPDNKGMQHPYLVIPEADNRQLRKIQGLPSDPFVDCGDRLRMTEKNNVPGIHTPYTYLSGGAGSATCMHIEDGMLGSANVVLAGYPKIWLFVPPSHRQALEARVRAELLNLEAPPEQKCTQFIRHQSLLLSPRLLDQWRIPYHLVCCRAGEMVVTLPGTYHQVINVGSNYAEAINFAASSDYVRPPDSYRFCTADCMGEGEKPLTLEHFLVQEECRGREKDRETRRGKGDGEFEREIGGRKKNVRRGNEKDGEDNRVETGCGSDKRDESKEEEEEDIEDDEREAEEGVVENTSALLEDLSKAAQPLLSGTSTLKRSPIPISNARKRVSDGPSRLGRSIRRRVECANNERAIVLSSTRLAPMSDSTGAEWRDCEVQLRRAAVAGGFNPDTIAKAFHAASVYHLDLKSAVKGLRFICDVAHPSQLLVVKQILAVSTRPKNELYKPSQMEQEQLSSIKWHIRSELAAINRVVRGLEERTVVAMRVEYEKVYAMVMFYLWIESLTTRMQQLLKSARRLRKLQISSTPMPYDENVQRLIQAETELRDQWGVSLADDGGNTKATTWIMSELARMHVQEAEAVGQECSLEHATAQCWEYRQKGKCLLQLIPSTKSGFVDARQLILLPIYGLALGKNPFTGLQIQSGALTTKPITIERYESEKKKIGPQAIANAKYLPSSVFRTSKDRENLRHYIRDQLTVARPEFVPLEREGWWSYCDGDSNIRLENATPAQVVSTGPADAMRLFVQI